MDDILARASNQAVSFAIRSGISLASGYAIKTLSRFLDRIPEAKQHPIFKAKEKLDRKLSSVTQLISLIKLENVSKNSILKPTVDLIDDLEKDINQFNDRMDQMVHSTSPMNTKQTIEVIQKDLSELNQSLNEVVPYINLALNVTGLNFKNDSTDISFSSLLRAYSYLFAVGRHSEDVTTGPEFDFKFYSVFYNPSRVRYIEGAASSVSALSWKEEYARCRVQLIRESAFQYHIQITENYDDGRYHEDEVVQRKTYPVNNVLRQYYTASGKLLRLEDSDSPILVIKVKGKENELDYIAFSLYESIEASQPADAEESLSEESDTCSESDVKSTGDASKNSRLPRIKKESPSKLKVDTQHTLSSFQYLLRLAAVEESEQKEVCRVEDEKLQQLLGSRVQRVLSFEKQENNAGLTESQHNLDLESSTRQLKNLSLGSNS
ncbi:hypothetical protein FT663_04915 [Candidozyma haemuli var. vulneris]|uniref:Ran-specific GTPase-activating protein 30 n=1 Tax=Candidozyma haemuli TaxID=45357 RepID=A0A2V1AMP1_9ASCO|nr:hypothetical protein CXQ85_001350 [[Candida] haemuloni]KAF3985702.1 hypothetical protein FT662_04989 [[Candida] haemuloni var. vulneris]KAF3986370.1 hypothetical protein FT663_04915 [[Candida] haemuloni var. vulneris]PVH19055.1 hypothetical protein CXQ85_001350 [[Candida] haemuloni]